jgi:hypothetical protein
VRNFYRENELRLTIDDEQMMTDCGFPLVSDGGDAFNYHDGTTAPNQCTRRGNATGS